MLFPLCLAHGHTVSEKTMTKAEEKRAAIIAQQEARQRVAGPTVVLPSRASNWAATPAKRVRRAKTRP